MPIWLVLAIAFLVLWFRDDERRHDSTRPAAPLPGRPGYWIEGGTVNGGQLGQQMANPVQTAGVWTGPQSDVDGRARF